MISCSSLRRRCSRSCALGRHPSKRRVVAAVDLPTNAAVACPVPRNAAVAVSAPTHVARPTPKELNAAVPGVAGICGRNLRGCNRSCCDTQAAMIWFWMTARGALFCADAPTQVAVAAPSADRALVAVDALVQISVAVPALLISPLADVAVICGNIARRCGIDAGTSQARMMCVWRSTFGTGNVE